MTVLFTLLAFALMFGYRRLTGLWVGPAELGPRSRILWLVHSGLIIACVGFGALTRGSAGFAWAGWVTAGVALVGTIALGRALDDQLRGETRRGTAKVQHA